MSRIAAQPGSGQPVAQRVGALGEFLARHGLRLAGDLVVVVLGAKGALLDVAELVAFRE
jgi:hypothetical protein